MKKSAILAAVVLSALASQSQAAVWTLQYSGTPLYTEDGIDAMSELTATITTADVLTNSELGAGYKILDITGTRNGQAITGVFSAAGEPFFSYGIDPYIYPDAVEIVSFTGIAYKSADGGLFNLYGSTFDFGGSGAVTNWFEVTNTASTNPNSSNVIYAGTLSLSAVAAVPEPGSWALMIGGFGLVGAAVRRRARQTGQQA